MIEVEWASELETACHDNEDRFVRQWWLHMYHTWQAYGGPEEGGWWYDAKVPNERWTPIGPIEIEGLAYAICRAANKWEDERRENEEDYEFTSAANMIQQGNYYTFDIQTSKEPEQFYRPRYE